MNVVLSKVILFNSWELKPILLKPGTEVFIDLTTGIAHKDGNSFDLEKSEYETVN